MSTTAISVCIKASLAALLFSPALLSCAEVDACGNRTEVWIHRTVDDTEACSTCTTITFATPILIQESFRIRPQPDHVIGRCAIERVEVRSDGVALVLSREGYEPVAALRKRSGPEDLAVLLLAGRKVPFGVVFVEDLRRRIPLFDFQSEAQIEQFVQELGTSGAAVYHAAAPAVEARESDATRRAKALLRQLEREEPILDQLRDAVESDDSDSVREILRELEPDPSDS